MPGKDLATIRENINYLKLWQMYNPSFINTLSIQGESLYYENGEEKRNVFVGNILFQSLLTPNLKTSLENGSLTPLDLYNIIAISAQTKAKDEKARLKRKVTDVSLGENCLVIVDEEQNKYRFDTNNGNDIYSKYVAEKNKGSLLTLQNIKDIINGQPLQKDYYDIIKQNSLSEEDLNATIEYENYIKAAKYYAPFLTEDTLRNVTYFDMFYQTLANITNLSPLLKSKLGIYQSEIGPIKNKLEQQEIARAKEEELKLVRQNKKDLPNGYANAAALIFVVLNLGLFLASLLIFLR